MPEGLHGTSVALDSERRFQSEVIMAERVRRRWRKQVQRTDAVSAFEIPRFFFTSVNCNLSVTTSL